MKYKAGDLVVVNAYDEVRNEQVTGTYEISEILTGDYGYPICIRELDINLTVEEVRPATKLDKALK